MEWLIVLGVVCCTVCLVKSFEKGGTGRRHSKALLDVLIDDYREDFCKVYTYGDMFDVSELFDIDEYVNITYGKHDLYIFEILDIDGLKKLKNTGDTQQ